MGPASFSRRLLALLLAGWVMAVPLTSFALNTVLCRHRALHEGMQHMGGRSSHTSCWCADMTGNGALAVAEAPALPADPAPAPRETPTGAAIASPLDRTVPPSPTYAPTPPPPNRRPA